MSKSNYFFNLLEEENLIGVIRSATSLDNAKAQFKALAKSGIKLVEISVGNKYFLELFSWAKEDYPKVCVGAATVLKTKQAKLCLENNVDFIVSPVNNFEVYELLEKEKIPYIPGASTPTEIANIINYSPKTKIVKLFPTGDPVNFLSIKKVFPEVEFLLSGFEAKYLHKFVKAGAQYFAVGGYLTESLALTSLRVHQMKGLIK